MSKRFLTKLAGGVVLGSAALLIGTPVTAFAATDGPSKQPRNEQREWKRDSKDDKRKHKTFKARDKDGNGVVCATNDQNAEAGVAQTISNNTISGGVNVFNQIGAAAATNVNAQAIVVCIRNLDVDVDVEVDLLNDILETVQFARTPAAGSSLGQSGNIPALGGAYAGPGGAWVLPANGGVAAGEGGVASTNTGPLAAAGAGLMGVGVLGGMGLLRRRSADGTVA